MITLPSSVRLAHPETGPVIEITHPVGRAQLHLLGAHVTSWRPAGHGEQLWVSAESEFGPGSAIRGGVPVCFPWFATGAGDWEPQHGFARRQRWRLVDAAQTRSQVQVACALDDRDLRADTPGRDRWPYRFAAVLEVTITAAKLTLHLAVTNPDTHQELPISGALHTYLAVGDIADTRIEGLGGLAHLDKVAGVQVPAGPRQDLEITGEIDRVYRHPGDGPQQTVVRGRDCDLTVTNRSSHSVLWNPWQAKAATMSDFPDDGWREMVCVEAALPVTADGDWPVRIAPGGRHDLVQEIRVGSDPDADQIRLRY